MISTTDTFGGILEALGAENNSTNTAIGITFAVTFVLTFLIAFPAGCLLSMRKKPASKKPENAEDKSISESNDMTEPTNKV